MGAIRPLPNLKNITVPVPAITKKAPIVSGVV
jgi:hypothetical protein